MGRRRRGYGSEDQLIRFRTNHPELLDSYINAALPHPGEIIWLYPAEGVAEEPKDLTFVDFTEPLRKLWRDVWPNPGNRSWDGIARCNGKWLLFEAKANEAELFSPGSGASPPSLQQIIRAWNEVKLFLGVPSETVWHGRYYQYKNRLAALYFVNVVAKIPARPIFLYFTGDVFPDERRCPQNEQAWRQLISNCHAELRLPATHKLSDRTHEVCIPVTPSGSR